MKFMYRLAYGLVDYKIDIKRITVSNVSILFLFVIRLDAA